MGRVYETIGKKYLLELKGFIKRPFYETQNARPYLRYFILPIHLHPATSDLYPGLLG